MWIVACLEGSTPTRTAGSSIYPAVENMLLAARALGLRATLTTLTNSMVTQLLHNCVEYRARW